LLPPSRGWPAVVRVFTARSQSATSPRGWFGGDAPHESPYATHDVTAQSGGNCQCSPPSSDHYGYSLPTRPTPRGEKELAAITWQPTCLDCCFAARPPDRHHHQSARVSRTIPPVAPFRPPDSRSRITFLHHRLPHSSHPLILFCPSIVVDPGSCFARTQAGCQERQGECAAPSSDRAS
jgi:hypothetical protein